MAGLISRVNFEAQSSKKLHGKVLTTQQGVTACIILLAKKKENTGWERLTDNLWKLKKVTKKERKETNRKKELRFFSDVVPSSEETYL